jgi:UDP-3-O-[3-hydroxymyristoyl] glucosamine N-acyltransferase
LFPLSKKEPLTGLIGGAWERLSRDLPALGAPSGAPPEIVGPDFGVGSLHGAMEPMGEGSLAFAAEGKHLALALQNGARGIITTPALGKDQVPATLVLIDSPRLLFAAVLNVVDYEARPPLPEGEPLFKDKSSVTLGGGVRLGPFSYIGANVMIGARSVVGPYVFIEDDVEVGEDTILHPRATLRWGVKIGSRCQIHSGSVIGGDGFGYTQVPGNARLVHYKNAHLGSVTIGDDVEIGSLTAVDRGLVEDTVVASGTKLDNLVQVGHNVRIGRDAIIVSQVGIGGHTQVGDRAFILGQVGLSHGAVVGEDAILTGQSGVTGKVPPGRRAWGGTPARPMEDYLRDQGHVHRSLPLWNRFLRLFKKSGDFAELKKAFLEAEGQEKPGKT